MQKEIVITITEWKEVYNGSLGIEIHKISIDITDNNLLAKTIMDFYHSTTKISTPTAKVSVTHNGSTIFDGTIEGDHLHGAAIK
jgi:hypothetical protein